MNKTSEFVYKSEHNRSIDSKQSWEGVNSRLHLPHDLIRKFTEIFRKTVEIANCLRTVYNFSCGNEEECLPEELGSHNTPNF